MKLLTAVGTRPQFIKYAALREGLRARHEELLADTGQHYDHALAQGILDGFGIGEPEHRLRLTTSDPGGQLAEMLTQLSAIIAAERPDALLCFGDTNSTLAASLAAVKQGVPIIHVEAGERNFDGAGTRVHPRLIPEEANRVMVDHVSSLLCCASPRALASLEAENVRGRAVYTGDITYDLFVRARADLADGDLRRFGVEAGNYFFCTVHRALNTDDRDRLAAIVSALIHLPLPAILPLHPRTRKMLVQYGLMAELEGSERVRLLEPVGYADSVLLSAHASAVITDSGGVVREAYFNRVPSVFLDDTTEWVDIMESGWSQLCGADEAAILEAVTRRAPDAWQPLYGDGNAVERTIEAIEGWSC